MGGRTFLSANAASCNIKERPDYEYLGTYFFPPKLVATMEDNLKRALTLDNDPKVQARLRLVQREFTYLKNLVSIFNYYHAYRLSNSWAVFDLLENELKRRDALTDSWYDAKGKMKVEDGWPRFFDNVDKDFLKKGGRLTGTLSVPFNWDMASLRKKKMDNSSQKPKQMTAQRLANGLVVDRRSAHSLRHVERPGAHGGDEVDDEHRAGALLWSGRSGAVPLVAQRRGPQLLRARRLRHRHLRVRR